jgi:hypothetical protein
VHPDELGRGGVLDARRLGLFLERLAERTDRPATLYVVGEASEVLEGWRAWTDRLVYDADVAPADVGSFHRAVAGLARSEGIRVEHEPPEDVIPLPTGYRERAIPATGWGDPGGRGSSALRVRHFDPYSTAFRLLARGDEPDYRVVLAFLERRWLDLDRMRDLLDGLLPRFTSDALEQDPAEFRRKFKGLAQIWRARSQAAAPAPRGG